MTLGKLELIGINISIMMWYMVLHTYIHNKDNEKIKV